MTFREAVRDVHIAYLSTLYPALSHTFIEREVSVLRKLGASVHTFGVRRPAGPDLLGAQNVAAARTTTYLLGDPLRLALANTRALALHPLRYLSTLLWSQTISPPGLLARVRHLAYFAEAIYLVRHLQTLGVAHVHVHFANNGAVVSLLAHRFDRTLTYSLTVHGPLEFAEPESMRLDEKTRHAEFVRCISKFGRAQLMMYTDVECWPRFLVSHCGVDPDAFHRGDRTPRTAEPSRLLAIGRLAPMKGFHVLLEACSRIPRAWRLDLVGDGPMLASLQKRAVDLGISDRVCFHGALGQEAIASLFDEAEVLVVSSFMEGLPVVIMEAMAKELPVVATRVAGIPEIVEDGVNGVLVDPGDPEALAAAISSLAADPERRERLGRAGRTRVQAEFSIAQTGDEMLSAFRRLESARGRGSDRGD